MDKNQQIADFFSNCIPKNTLMRNKYEIKQIFGNDLTKYLEKELKRKSGKRNKKKRLN